MYRIYKLGWISALVLLASALCGAQSIVVGRAGCTADIAGNVVCAPLGGKLTVLDGVTPSKILQFDLSGIGASTTRTVTVPNANSTLVVPFTCSNQFATAANASGVFSCGTVAYSQISGTPTLAATLANVSHKWLNSYNASTGLFAQSQPASTDLSDFSATAPSTPGQIPIFNGTQYVPGDPLVQGLFADSSTSAANPVIVGGYDTAATPASHRAILLNGAPAGTEYGMVTRPIPSGTQSISGTVTGNQGTPAAAANRWPVQLTDGTNLQAVNASGGSEVTGDTPSASADAGNPVKTGGVFNTAQPTVTSGQRVDNQSTARGAQIVAPGVENTAANAWFAKITDGTNTAAVKAASTAAAAADPSSVVQLSPNQPALTTPLNVKGALTHNTAAPGSDNIGTLNAQANAATPSLTEGNGTKLSMDLAGNLRVYGHPPNVLGCYMVNGRTSTYAGLAAGTPLFSFRWGDATRIAIINHVKVNVITTVAATTAGQAERELIVARSFSASDTGGTAVTLTGNNQKMRTSQGTSLVTDMRFGTTITAGTRTLDANPIASAIAWLPLNMTGVDIGCNGAGPTGAVWACVSSSGYIDLLNTANGQDYPLILATNEGFIVRVGKDAMPAGATQQTYLTIGWCEANAY